MSHGDSVAEGCCLGGKVLLQQIHTGLCTLALNCFFPQEIATHLIADVKQFLLLKRNFTGMKNILKEHKNAKHGKNKIIYCSTNVKGIQHFLALIHVCHIIARQIEE